MTILIARPAGHPSGTQDTTRCTSFNEALAVPRLAEACMEVLTSDQLSGIKVLRAVSKGTREVLHRMIKQFTVSLGGGHGRGHAGFVKILQGVSLHSLTMEVCTVKDLAPLKHWRYLSTIVPAIHPALRSVTDLKILALPHSTRPKRFWLLGAMIFSFHLPLVYSISPRYTWVYLLLLFLPGLMLAFDCKPSGLNSQAAIFSTVWKGLTTDTVKELSNLLPSIISFADFLQSETLRGWLGTHERTDIVSAMCTTLNACPRLLRFYSSQPMSAEIWATLPHSLTHCATSGIASSMLCSHSSPPPVWQQHSSIISMELLFPERLSLSLQELAIFLSASPALQVLYCCGKHISVSITLTSRDLPDYLSTALHLLNTRLQAGLSIMIMDNDSQLIPSHIWLVFGLGKNPASHFMTSRMLPLPAISHPVFYCNSVKLEMSQLTRVFSGIQSLWLMDTTLDGADLMSLGSCPQLETLVLARCSDVTCAGIAALCAVCPKLRRMCCITCKHMSEVDGQWMGREGWGGDVIVLVENGGLDGKWNN